MERDSVRAVFTWTWKDNVNGNDVDCTYQHQQGVEEAKLDHLLDVGHKGVGGMVDGVDVHAEGCAGHDIHAVRPKHSAGTSNNIQTHPDVFAFGW